MKYIKPRPKPVSISNDEAEKALASDIEIAIHYNHESLTYYKDTGTDISKAIYKFIMDYRQELVEMNYDVKFSRSGNKRMVRLGL